MIQRLPGVLILLFYLPVAQSQPIDTLRGDLELLASIPDARHLAADAEGKLYVVTEREIVLLESDGQEQFRLGGSGIDDGAFEEVLDIDPGTGLVWAVADAGSGRVMRFSRTLLHLESLFVPPASYHGKPVRASREDPRDDEWQDTGRPIAVAVSLGGELFAIEEDTRRVLKWDASRRFERIIGGFDAAIGQLQEPISLAADAEILYVADRGASAVLAFDYYGGYLRSYPARSDVTDVWIAESELWIVLRDAIWIYTEGDRRTRVLHFDLEAPILAAVAVKPWIVLLTAGKLWRVNI